MNSDMLMIFPKFCENLGSNDTFTHNDIKIQFEFNGIIKSTMTQIDIENPVFGIRDCMCFPLIESGDNDNILHVTIIDVDNMQDTILHEYLLRVTPEIHNQMRKNMITVDFGHITIRCGIIACLTPSVVDKMKNELRSTTEETLKHKQDIIELNKKVMSLTRDCQSLNKYKQIVVACKKLFDNSNF